MVQYLISNLKMTKARGFTLIELIISIGLFAFMTTILISTLMKTQRFKTQLEDKNILHQELVSVLNNGISGLIRSGFAIDYDRTNSSASDGGAVGIQESVDQLSIFTDQAETEYFTIYRKAFSEKEGVSGGQLYVKFNDEEEFPLHSSEIFIEDFDVSVPDDPRFIGDRDLQSYVKIHLRASQNNEPIDEKNKSIKAAYSTTYTLRNAGLASYKNAKL